ncbi:MAG: FGGY family carbohydrate kinase [Sphaerochaeta sp.]|nr:FGGY family carbohydrate kinase [Sphaerochaeta sp.]
MIAVFDIGTSAIKGIVLDGTQAVVYSAKKEIRTIRDQQFIEQDPNEWYKAFCSMLKEYQEKTGSIKEIGSVIMSGHMQDVICVDQQGDAVRNAIMYNDQRGASHLHLIADVIAQKTSVEMNGTIPLPKLLWMQEHERGVLDRTHKVLNSAKDYIIGKLTGRFVSDVTSLSTSGMLDIRERTYVQEVKSLGIDHALLPDICYADEVVGLVLPKASEQTLLSENVKVYAGCGDAGSTTLASGIINSGELNINLGTSGWVAAISLAPRQGVFNLVAINRGMYINVIPVLNAASVHKWIATLIFPDDPKKYDRLHDLLAQSGDTRTELFCLPYLAGERFPVADTSIRGSFIGLDGSTTSRDMALSALEGVAFSLKQGFEKLEVVPSKISLIGGGAEESVWNQIFANVFDTPITVFSDSEYLPSIALAAAVLLHEGKISSYQDCIDSLLTRQGCTTFIPKPESAVYYRAAYEQFKLIYPATKALFAT